MLEDELLERVRESDVISRSDFGFLVHIWEHWVTYVMGILVVLLLLVQAFVHYHTLSGLARQAGQDVNDVLISQAVWTGLALLTFVLLAIVNYEQVYHAPIILSGLTLGWLILIQLFAKAGVSPNIIVLLTTPAVILILLTLADWFAYREGRRAARFRLFVLGALLGGGLILLAWMLGLLIGIALSVALVVMIALERKPRLLILVLGLLVGALTKWLVFGDRLWISPRVEPYTAFLAPTTPFIPPIQDLRVASGISILVLLIPLVWLGWQTKLGAPDKFREALAAGSTALLLSTGLIGLLHIAQVSLSGNASVPMIADGRVILLIVPGCAGILAGIAQTSKGEHGVKLLESLETAPSDTGTVRSLWNVIVDFLTPDWRDETLFVGDGFGALVKVRETPNVTSELGLRNPLHLLITTIPWLPSSEANWIHSFEYRPRHMRRSIPFQMTSRRSGHRVFSDFYHERHWVGKATLTPDLTESTITDLAPIEYQDYNVDLVIRIFNEGARYSADLLTKDESHRIGIDVSPHDLELLSLQFQEALQPLVNEYADTGPGRDEETERAARLHTLARRGYYAFSEVFNDDIGLIKRLLAGDKVRTVQVVSEDFILPWELMYPVSPENPQIEQFWGMKHKFSRIVVQGSRPGAFASPSISVDGRPRIGLLADESLPCVLGQDLPLFRQLAKQGQIELQVLRAFNADHRQEELKDLRAFLGGDYDIVHFACHAKYNRTTPSASAIVVTNEFPVRVDDLTISEINFRNHPLVILNACEMADMNPLYTASFARAFLKRGARGVVATECSVPDGFAAEFGRELYRRLLPPIAKNLGDALYETRWHFWARGEDPSGLLYSMYAPPSIKLKQTGGST